jgi:RNA 2',3'-cyclic 3'-phosphodiesterase
VPDERLKSPRLRLFVALDLPGLVLDPLVEWRDRELASVPDARLVSPDSLHVTLVFLGYQYERDVDRIAQACFGEPAGPFQLRPSEVVAVPPKRPRLYALSLEDAGEAVTAWQGELSARLQAERLYEPERRPFWPHVTLARGKRNRALPRLDHPPAVPATLEREFAPARATLYRSTLTPQGAIYDSLSELALR